MALGILSTQRVITATRAWLDTAMRRRIGNALGYCSSTDIGTPLTSPARSDGRLARAWQEHGPAQEASSFFFPGQFSILEINRSLNLVECRPKERTGSLLPWKRTSTSKSLCWRASNASNGVLSTPCKAQHACGHASS